MDAVGLRGIGSTLMSAVLPPDQEERLKTVFLGERPGFYVEVGANDPVAGSQSWHLEQAGWSGILIEPLPDLAKKLRETRKGLVFNCACSSPSNSGKRMQLHVLGPLSSFSPQLMDYRATPVATIDVATHTLDDVLSLARAPIPIDFLSIDVEGHEIEVLTGFDFERWAPRLILIEDHLRTLSRHRFLSSRGYRLYRRTGLNNWYVPQASPHRPSLIGRLQLIRKFYLGLPVRLFRDNQRRRITA